MRQLITPFIIAAGVLVSSMPVFAQSNTTGAIQGVVEDEDGAPIVGATVVATSPALQGTQAELTESNGSYFIANLPPGTYDVTVFYGDGKWTRQNIIINLGKTAQVNLDINTGAAGSGETIIVEGTAPVIDVGSSKTGVTINEDYTRRIPTGTTFQGTLGAAAGSQGDQYGVSFAGSTSIENTYIIEGVNVTDPAYGGVASDARGSVTTTNLPNEFVGQTEVITGGYNAEFGRATGAIVNVVTKSGGNEFHGSVFSYFQPGALSPTPQELPEVGNAIAQRAELNYNISVGGEVGGPIIKDKLWFHVGFNPVFTSTDIDRTVKTFLDEDNNGIADVDENGFELTRDLSTTTFDTADQRFNYHGKLSYAATPDHQGSVAVFGNPGTGETYLTLRGDPNANLLENSDGAYDVSTKWTSKFNDNQTQLDAVAGFHRNRNDQLPVSDAADSRFIFFTFNRPLEAYSAFEPGGQIPGECIDGGADDPYPMMVNCPVRNYNVGGLDLAETQETDRLSAAFKVTQRVQAAGHHQFKVGADIENMSYAHGVRFPGGERFSYRATSVRADRWFIVNDDAMPVDGFEPAACGTFGDALCEFSPDGLVSDTTSRSLGAFVQDSWSILPNLTVNAGLRWEQQTGYTAEGIQGQISGSSGAPIPDVAFKLENMFAPRLGVIYDWTEEGRSKAFAHWGRFYEMVPMDINARAFGGEVFAISFLGPDACTDPDAVTMDPSAAECDYDASAPFFLGSGEEPVVPGLKGQYLDEFVSGVEYELFEDFKVGGTFISRSLGRIIEDVSLDGASTYIIANPGEAVGSEDIQALLAEAAMTADPDRAAFLQNQAVSFALVERFDEPVRRYNGLQLSAEQRFSRNVMVLASYTYSNLEGNFPGLFSPETGQLDPNLTSMYDLPELMANRYGPLAADKPHLVKLDGYYLFDAGESIGDFIFGTSVRGASGRPVNTLGGHPIYGSEESYILPRGLSARGDERTPFTTSFDARVTYGRNIGKGMRVEGFLDVFNIFNTETRTAVDEEYTEEPVNPIVGGDREDVRHLKPVRFAAGGLVDPTGETVLIEQNYGNTVADQAVRVFRFGARLTF